MLEDPVDAGQGPVIEPLEDIPFKDEAFAVSLVRVDHLFEGKQVVLDAPISNQVDDPDPTPTKETFYRIVVSSGASYGNSLWKQYLLLLRVVHHTCDQFQVYYR